MSRIKENIESILAFLLTLFGLFVLFVKPVGGNVEASAGLSGALFGSAAVLIGNAINGYYQQSATIEKEAAQVEKIKTLIAAELINIVCGLIDAKRIIDAAIATIDAGGSVSDKLDMARYLPRPMPFTDSLGVEILLLDKKAVDAIATLRSNLEITRKEMNEITAGSSFRLKVRSLSDSLAFDSGVLAELLTYIAPNRKLKMESNDERLVVDILREISES